MKARGIPLGGVVGLGLALGFGFPIEAASFPDAADACAPPNDIAELIVDLAEANLKLTVRYAQPLGLLDRNFGAVFIDTHRDPDTPADPFQFGADRQILFLLMDGYVKGTFLAEGQTSELSAERVAPKADRLEFTLPLEWVGGSPNFRFFATSSHLPEGSRYDGAPDAGWWDTESELVVVPRPGDEQVHLVYDDPAGDATMPDLTRVEERVRNGNVEFWFTFAHGVEPGDLPAWATMLDLAVRMDLDHRLWTGYRNDDEWSPTFGIERTLNVSFGRLFALRDAHGQPRIRAPKHLRQSLRRPPARPRQPGDWQPVQRLAGHRRTR